MTWPWYAYALIGGLLAESLLVVESIGKPRYPVTSGRAVVILVGNVLAGWAVVALAEGAS